MLEITFPEGVVQLTEHAIAVYPLHSSHRVRTSAPDTSYYWMTFDGPHANEIVTSFALIPPWPKHPGPAPEALFAEAARLLGDPSLHAERQAAAIGWMLLSAAATGPTPAEDAAVAHVLAVLTQGVSDPDISIERIADQLRIERTQLSRRFKAIHGVSPKQWLSSLRLHRAMGMLASSDMSVQQIAVACGYRTGNYLARAFKEATERTPEEFRRTLR